MGQQVDTLMKEEKKRSQIFTTPKIKRCKTKEMADDVADVVWFIDERECIPAEYGTDEMISWWVHRLFSPQERK